MLEVNPQHVACGESSLFHGSTCESRKSNDVAGRVDVRNGGLKKLIDFYPSSRVRNQSSSFHMKLIAVALPPDGVDECVTLYCLAALQLREYEFTVHIRSNAHHLFC